MKYASLFPIAMGFILATSCSDTDFASSGGKPAAKKIQGSDQEAKKIDPVDNAGGEQADLTESFLSEGKSSASQADIMWVLDTSGSMRGEMDLVSQNLSNFFNKIDAASDAKVGIIYGQSSMPLTISQELQSKITIVDQKVGSSNALQIFDQFIGTPQGMNFYRPDAVKILVTVTDDNSRLDHSNFLASIGSVIGTDKFRGYAFAGKVDSAENNMGCRIARVGTEYQELADETGAQVFDICLPDWSKSFDQLTSSIIKELTSSFELKQQIKDVLSVTLDGVPLAEENYSYSGATINIKSGVITENGQSIEVTYIPSDL